MTARNPEDASSGAGGELADRNLLAAIHMLSNRIGRAFDPELQERFGISVPEWRVMLLLAHRPGASMAEITDVWAMDKMTVSRAVVRLEQGGRLVRQRRAADKRRYALQLTDKGRAFYAEIEPSATARYRDILAVLDDGERTQLSALLAKLTARLAARATERR